MKILTCSQMRKADQYTIEHEPISSVDLMERAAQACVNWLRDKFPVSRKIKIVAGPGNNGGDGLAIARLMTSLGYGVNVYLFSSIEKLSPDAFDNYNRLIVQGKVQVEIIEDSGFPELDEDDIIIDALFGSGLTRSLEGMYAKVVQLINQSGAIIVSIDIPSGLFGEDNTTNHPKSIINAEYTITFQLPKLAFFFAENEQFTGELVVLDIHLLQDSIDREESIYYLNMLFEMKELVKYRSKFSHKGNYGHALLVSGSYGKMGAAILASGACLRTGVGLLTIHIPKIGYNILQTSVPEAMVTVDDDTFQISCVPEWEKYSAIGIGPGIGTSEVTSAALLELITKYDKPLVVDADALNILSMHPDWIRKLPANSILTPHPREFDRIAGPSVNGYERHLKQIDFSRKNKVIIILKGAYTSIALPDGQCCFNSTGNPGMATAGSGDVLTGIVLSLLTQGYNPSDAACLGVYLHGLAGDIGVQNASQEALIATDIINSLGIAFKKIKKEL